MARVQTVEKSLKSPGACGKCNTIIAKGQPYRWFKFRYGGGGKRVRCTAAACAPRPSELTGSDKLSRVYAVGESVSDALEAFRESYDLDDLKSALTDGAEQLREVAGEYRESAENMESGMNGNRMPMCDELEEKADHLEGVADELDSAEANLPERDEDEDSVEHVDELTDEQVCEMIGVESAEGTFEAHLLEHVQGEHDDFDGKSEGDKASILSDARETLIEAKRDELREEAKEKLDAWVAEVEGEVEQFTSIDVS